jgi:ABC-type transport system involved in multi-copper enzyme maturation permease subunit
MSPFRETALVLAHETRRNLRSAKTLVLLILYSLATALSGFAFVTATRKLQEGLGPMTGGQELSAEQLSAMKMGGLSIIFGKDEALLRYLAGIPLVVIFFFWFTLHFLPLLTALMGFDQISGELQTRSLRFVSLRARRGSVLAGKVLAQAVLLFGLTAIVNLGVFAYAALSTEGFAVGEGLLSLVRFWLLGLAFASAYLGLAALASSLYRTPIFSLLTILCALIGFSILGFLSRFESLSALAWAVPSHYEEGLYSPQWSRLLPSVGAHCAFAAIFLAAAFLALRARDL